MPRTDYWHALEVAMRFPGAIIAIPMLLATSAAAQEAPRLRDSVLPRGSALPLERAAGKSPVVAGVLSFLVPFGTGSFYAGNSGHGYRHLAVGIGSIGVFVLAAVAAEGNTQCDAVCTEAGVAGGAVILFTLNWIVGTVTAVIDAGHSNRPLTGPTGALTPAVLTLASHQSVTGLSKRTPPRLGIRLVRVAF
jgi:hypothetical protein